LPANSDFQDSVERTRQAFLRTPAPELREVSAHHAPFAEGDAPEPGVRGKETGGEAGPEGDRSGDRRDPMGLHPFFRGLLDTLPDPGADWPLEKREQWLETARSIFALVYTDPVEERRPLRLLDAQQQAARSDSQFEQRTG
jgi:hypothetical protein